MASSIILIRLTCMVLMCMMVCAPLAQASISCNQVVGSLASCITYVKSNGSGAVPSACCKGISSLSSSAKTTADRRAACDCLKKAAGAIAGVNRSLIAGLPAKCNVRIPYKISTSTNCKTIK
ncbi:non-specific lipid-transfer protein 1-like [Corylus avellana]|uniref:non-specific lipid-transfer protein 1-like n=1 Tax=Corylus avellana TaxID=13451 RepID=UPI00286D1CBF|nr:non-specific lipid-transfer protein 1-like [Corylus avellana]